MPGEGDSVRIRKDVIFRDLEGELVLLNLETGVYFGLDAVGSRIWELLAADRCLADVVATLTSEYEVEAEACEADLARFLETLADNELVDRHDGPPR